MLINGIYLRAHTSARCVDNLTILSQDDAAERRRRLPEVGGAVGAQTRGNARHRHQAHPSAPQIRLLALAILCILLGTGCFCRGIYVIAMVQLLHAQKKDQL